MSNNNANQHNEQDATEIGAESVPDRALQYALVGASAVASYLFFKYGANGGYGDEIGASYAGLAVAAGAPRVLKDAPRVRVALSRLKKAHSDS